MAEQQGLSGAGTIAGAVVEISVGLDGLRTQFQQAQNVTQQEIKKLSTVAVIKPVVDEGALRQQFEKISRTLQNITQGERTASGIANYTPAALANIVSHGSPMPFGANPQTATHDQLNRIWLDQAKARDKAAADSKAAATARIREIQQERQEVAAMAKDIAAGRAPGGGGGSGAGGVNPFSLRGLARIAGNAALVYGASLALNTSAEAADAYNTYNNTGVHLRQFDRSMATGSAYTDPYMQARATDIAHAQGGLQALEAGKSIPILGSIVHLSDALGHLSESLRETAENADFASRAHVESLNTIESQAIDMAKLSGNPMAALQAQNRLTIRTLAHRADLNPNDPAAMQALTNALDYQSISEEHQGGLIFRANAWAEKQGLLVQRRAGTMLGSTFAQLNEDPAAQKASYMEQRAIAREMLENQHKQKIEEDRLAGGANQVGLRAAGVAALREFDISTITGRAQMDYARFREGVVRSARINSLATETSAMRMEDAGDPLGARLLRIDAETQGRLAQLPNTPINSDERARIQNLGDQQKASAKYQHRQDIMRANAGLEIRGGVANYQLQRMDAAAATFGQVQGLMQELRNAPPELRRQTAATTLKELAAMEMRLTPRGGTIADVSDPYSIMGTPDATRRTKERDAQWSEIQEAKKEAGAALRAQQELPGKIDKTNEWLGQIFNKIGQVVWG